MKQILSILFFILPIVSSAQNGKLGGILIDKTDNSPIPGATIFLKNETFSQGKFSNNKGFFLIDSIPYGEYTLTITSVGFAKIEKKITINKPRNFAGKLEMRPKSIELSTVKVEDKIPLAVQKGDTTEYNSAAYKTNQDATTGDLIEKMPGITTKNGEVNAQGEKVQQVLVDGKPYFGENPKSALSNIPAQVVQKIQVFDDESDESKATGFKDGNTIKTINIVTKPEYRNSKFGNVYAGYGTDERYNAGGNYNFFNGDQRISIVGLFNNVNQQNFSGEDLIGVATGSGKRGYRRRGNIRQSTNSFLVPQQNGIAKTSAGGFNYQDTWGKKTDVIGSYFYNSTKTDALENKLQTYFSNSEDNQIYEENDSSYTENANRKINFQLKHKFDKRNELVLRSNFGLQDNLGESFIRSNTSLGNNTQSKLNSDYSSTLLGYNTNIRLHFNHRFSKRGRSAFIQFKNSFNGNDGSSDLFSSEIDRLSIIDTIDQESKLLTKTASYGGKIRYTEPLGKKGGVMFDYNITSTAGLTNNRTFNYSALDDKYSLLAPEFSSQFESNDLTQQFSLGYRFFSKKIFTFLRAKYQLTDLKTTSVFPVTATTNNVFRTLLPFAMMKYTLSKSRYFFIMYNSNTTNPTVNQLQSYLDNSNPIQLQIGNSNLKQSLQNRIMARYITSNTDKATTFFAMASYSFSNNYIGSTSDFYRNDTTVRGVSLESGKILNSYDNVKGYRNLRMFASYGMPVLKIKSNLNLDAGMTYTRTPSVVNSIITLTDGYEYEIGVVLSSNISKNVDFTLSGRATVNDIQNQDESISSLFLTQAYKAKMIITLKRDFILRSQATYQLNTGFSDDLNVDFLLWNAGIAKKIFKNKKGEISLSVFDVLAQNNLLTVSTNETFVEQLQSKSLQRYGLITFRYTFSQFKKPKEDPMRQFYRRR